MPVFPCPFWDGDWHTVGALRSWEVDLLKARQLDQEFSSDIRRATGANARDKGVRNKELAPLELFAKHNNLDDSITFRMMPAGHCADVELKSPERILKLQMTIASPCWGSPDEAGHQYALKIELLARNGGALAAARFNRQANGDIVSEGGIVSESERSEACRTGMEIAIRKKMRQAGKGTILIVYARGFAPHVKCPGEFAALARSALRNVGFPPFDRVCFLEYVDDWYLEVYHEELGKSVRA
jgi:hypothetical protein